MAQQRDFAQVSKEPLDRQAKQSGRPSGRGRPLPRTNTGSYICDTCGLNFLDRRVLWKHKKDHSGLPHACITQWMEVYSVQIPHCDACDKDFANPKTLRGHNLNRHRGQAFACDKCDNSCKTSEGLEKHSLRVHVRATRQNETTTITPSSGGGDEDYHGAEPAKQMPSEAESRDQPYYQSQQPAMGARRSARLNLAATASFSELLTPVLTDDSYHTYEPSRACFPRQAGRTNSPYPNEPSLRHGREQDANGVTNPQPVNSGKCDLPATTPCGIAASSRTSSIESSSNAGRENRRPTKRSSASSLPSRFPDIAPLKEITNPPSAVAQEKICKYCGRKFKKIREHNRHVKIHEKPISCKADPNCEVRKAEEIDMVRHYAVAHKYYAAQKGIRVDPFPCDAPGCTEVFTRRDNLRRHYRKRHGESAEAEIANNGRMRANTKYLAPGRITHPPGREVPTTHASNEPPDRQPSNSGDDDCHDLLPEPTDQQPGLKSKRELRRGKIRKRQRSRGRNASEATATPGVEDSGQSQDPREERESQMLSEAESGVQPHNLPQQVAENTRYMLSFSYLCNSESSEARSPRQAGPTASSYSTNEPPRHRDRLTPGDDTVRLASELDYSKEASAMASVPAATDPRSLTTGSGMTLGGDDEEAGSPAPSYPDGIQSPGSRASWPGRYGSSIHVLDELPDHLRNDSPMADPPETGFSDEEDARSCTTLAGEEDRRSLTPAPFEGKGARTRNTREQQDISEPAATLEIEDVDQDQGRGANAIFPAGLNYNQLPRWSRLRMVTGHLSMP
ncbi:hypothetical protein MRS44_017808 [Fusarium solani]|uniref:uncharacterized protein n=1 Tax=Fusarium solani TaxID=169388 RepID=UPI0032C47317|nr:hypothetical protein MRS44_017808 [Fusarium solani]